jgi:hypothetical protein
MKQKFSKVLLLLMTVALSVAPAGMQTKSKDEDLKTSVQAALRANPETWA